MQQKRGVPERASQDLEAKTNLQLTANSEGNPAYIVDLQNHEGNVAFVCFKPQSIICYTAIDD